MPTKQSCETLNPESAWQVAEGNRKRMRDAGDVVSNAGTNAAVEPYFPIDAGVDQPQSGTTAAFASGTAIQTVILPPEASSKRSKSIPHPRQPQAAPSKLHDDVIPPIVRRASGGSGGGGGGGGKGILSPLPAAGATESVARPARPQRKLEDDVMLPTSAAAAGGTERARTISSGERGGGSAAAAADPGAATAEPTAAARGPGLRQRTTPEADRFPSGATVKQVPLEESQPGGRQPAQPEHWESETFPWTGLRHNSPPGGLVKQEPRIGGWPPAVRDPSFHDPGSASRGSAGQGLKEALVGQRTGSRGANPAPAAAAAAARGLGMVQEMVGREIQLKEAYLVIVSLIQGNVVLQLTQV